MNSSKQTVAFIGSYADAADPGIYACSFDHDTGKLQVLDQMSGIKNPSFLAINEKNNMLYAISEAEDSEGQRIGQAEILTFTDKDGVKLKHLNTKPSVPSPTCHISLDQTNRALFVSSYHGGVAGMISVSPEGNIEEVVDTHQHTGSSILPAQTQARVHSILVHPSNQYAIICDLGIDKVFVYKIDLDNGKMIPHQEVSLKPGAGPRHFAFHPSKPYGYVINELNATVTVFEFDEDKGNLTEVQTIPTLPEDYTGGNSCADIHVSSDGRFLYGSNRGHDSIVVYAIDANNGQLSLIEHVSTEGEHPRNFALTPDNRFLLVANMDSNNIVTFARDQDSGKLQSTGQSITLSRPVCIKFLEI